MADANPNRLGQINNAGDTDAIFLEMFSGEVLEAFETANKFLPRTYNKTVTSGKSFQFPAMGNTSAVYHTPGAQLLGQDSIKQAEITIAIDKKLLTHEFIADIDEAKNHWETRGRYAGKMGYALAKAMDQHILIESVLGARASATVSGEAGGAQKITDGNLNSTTTTDRAQAWIDVLFEAAEDLDGNDAPEEGRFVALTPADYYALVQAVQTNGFSAVHSDYGTDGSFSKGKIYNIANIELVKTNNLTQTDQSGGTGVYEEHPIDGSEVAGVVSCRDAVGVVRLMDLAVQSEFQIERQGTLLVASYAVGIGYLRPECLIELDHTA